MLEVSGVFAGYGRTEVLFDAGLRVGAGEFVTLLGRNGMGKTTLVKVIMGLLGMRQGAITFNRAPIGRQRAHRIAQMGLGLVPEGRLVCPNLTVRENLIATARKARPGDKSSWTLERVYALFPRLEERRHNMGNELSGGEQQLLAIGRALMTNPELLILDEATEGLAPLIRQEVWNCLDVLRRDGQSVLLIDKNIDVLERIADRHYVLEKGRIVWTGTSAQFSGSRAALEQYLGV